MFALIQSELITCISVDTLHLVLGSSGCRLFLKGLSGGKTMVSAVKRIGDWLAQ